MNAFLREHAGPIVGSAVLHVALAAAVLAATWYAVAPKITVPAVIEAYIAAPRAPHSTPVPVPVPAPATVPAPPPEPAPPAAAAPTETLPPPPAEARAREEAEQARAEAALAARREASKREEAAAQQKRAAQAEEARRRADAEAARRRAQAAEAKRAAEAAAEKRKADADAKLRAARESELARDLAAEEQRTGAENAGLLARYVAAIQASIERAWNRPPTARPGLRCIVNVTQLPGGTVTDVKIGECNGDAAVQQSLKVAVYHASPLPPPPDPSLFERNLKLVFAPDA